MSPEISWGCESEKKFFGLSKETIEQHAKQVAQEIYAYSCAQKSLWQKVPWLALEASGRTGWSDGYALAYTHGLWRLESLLDRFSHYTVYVDCATGRLVAAHNPKKVATPKDVALIAFSIAELDAALVVKRLEKETKAPYFKGYVVAEVEARRAKYAKDYGVTEIYERHNAMPSFNFCWD